MHSYFVLESSGVVNALSRAFFGGEKGLEVLTTFALLKQRFRGFRFNYSVRIVEWDLNGKYDPSSFIIAMGDGIAAEDKIYKLGSING